MATVGQHDPSVRWRQLRDDLWAASRDGTPLGTIERGRRYTVLDTEGEVLGRFEDLQVAMSSLVRRTRGGAAPSMVPVVAERTLVGLTSAFGLGAVAVIGYAIAAGLF